MNSTTLTFAEEQWISFFEGSEYPALRLATLLFVWHEIVFWGRYLPYVICDHLPFMQKYKIQPDKVVTNEQWWTCVKTVIRDQFLFQLPMMYGFHPIATALGMKFLDVPFPSWYNIGVAVLFFLLTEDCYQYFVHRLLHWGPFYKHIHKLHHTYSAPFGIAAEYAHPLETIFLGLGFFVGPLIWCIFSQEMHVFTMAVWLAARLIQTVDAHSGYDFPWALRHIIPFWAGSEFHDYHHRAFVGNYASSFRWWDDLFGTSKAFYQWKEKNVQKKVE